MALDFPTSPTDGQVYTNSGKSWTWVAANGGWSLTTSSGSTANVGEATIDFGSAPGTNVVSVAVTGQTTITTDATIYAFMASDSTASHNEIEHQFVPIKLTCGNIVAGTGFTIYAVTDLRLSGTFNVRWTWS